MYAKAMNAYTESTKTMSLMSKNTLRITEMMLEYREALNTIEKEKIRKQIETIKQIIQPVLVAKKPTVRPKKEPKCYYSVVGYATLKNAFLGIKKAAELGRKASALCRIRGIKTEEIPDPRFGRVKIYPSSVLEEVFATSACQ